MPNDSAGAENKLQPEHRQNQKVRNQSNQCIPQWVVYRSLAVTCYNFFNELAGKSGKSHLLSNDNFLGVRVDQQQSICKRSGESLTELTFRPAR